MGVKNEKNDPKAKTMREAARKRYTNHMEMMQARLTTLEPPRTDADRQHVTALLVVNCVKFHLTSL